MCVDTYSKDWKETHQSVSSSYSWLVADDFSILCVLFCLFLIFPTVKYYCGNRQKHYFFKRERDQASLLEGRGPEKA